jgi:hypothetical protein
MKNAYIRNPIVQNASWVPFEPIAVTSTSNDCSFASLSSVKLGEKQNCGWESDRLPSFPIQIVLKLSKRVELDFVIIRSKQGKFPKRILFFIADDIDGIDKGSISTLNFIEAG